MDTISSILETTKKAIREIHEKNGIPVPDFDELAHLDNECCHRCGGIGSVEICLVDRHGNEKHTSEPCTRCQGGIYTPRSNIQRAPSTKERELLGQAFERIFSTKFQRHNINLKERLK